MCECDCIRERKTGKCEKRVLERTVKQNVLSDVTCWTTFLLFLCIVKIIGPVVFTLWEKLMKLYSDCKYLNMCSLKMCCTHLELKYVLIDLTTYTALNIIEGCNETF